MKDSKLPAAALAKIFHLKDQKKEAEVLNNSTVERIGELERAIGYDPVHSEENGRNGALRSQLATLMTSRERHDARYRELADLNRALERYLETLPLHVELADAKPIKLKLEGETHLAAVERVRREITRLVSERLRVQQAGLPIEEVRKRVTAWVRDRARVSRPTVNVTDNSFTIRFDALVDGAYVPIPDIAAALAWFDPSGFEMKLNALIDDLPQPKLAMTAEAKAERLREISRELLTWERQEEALIMSADEAGQYIERRSTADPRAILGLIVRNTALAA